MFRVPVVAVLSVAPFKISKNDPIFEIVFRTKRDMAMNMACIRVCVSHTYFHMLTLISHTFAP